MKKIASFVGIIAAFWSATARADPAGAPASAEPPDERATETTAEAVLEASDGAERPDGAEKAPEASFEVAGAPGAAKDKPLRAPRDLRVGAIAGVGVPGGLEAGVITTYKQFLGVGADAGALPTMKVPGVPHNARITRLSAEVGARLYPLKGPFFVGTALGYAHVTATLEQKFTAYGVSAPGTVRADLSSVYVKPELGFLWKWDMGLMVGADLGVVVPVAAKESSVAASAGGQSVDVKGKLADVFASAGKTPLPALALLRVGWLI